MQTDCFDRIQAVTLPADIEPAQERAAVEPQTPPVAASFPAY